MLKHFKSMDYLLICFLSALFCSSIVQATSPKKPKPPSTPTRDVSSNAPSTPYCTPPNQPTNREVPGAPGRNNNNNNNIDDYDPENTFHRRRVLGQDLVETNVALEPLLNFVAPPGQTLEATTIVVVQQALEDAEQDQDENRDMDQELIDRRLARTVDATLLLQQMRQELGQPVRDHDLRVLYTQTYLWFRRHNLSLMDRTNDFLLNAMYAFLLSQRVQGACRSGWTPTVLRHPDLF